MRQPRWGRQSISAASQPASASQCFPVLHQLSTGLGNSGSGTRNHQFASVRELPTNNLSKIPTDFHFRCSGVTCTLTGILSVQTPCYTPTQTCYVLQISILRCAICLSDTTQPSEPDLSSSTVKIEKSHQSRNKGNW